MQILRNIICLIDYMYAKKLCTLSVSAHVTVCVISVYPTYYVGVQVHVANMALECSGACSLQIVNMRIAHKYLHTYGQTGACSARM